MMDHQSTKKSRAGRPTAEQALRKALEPFRATGFDHSLVDGLNVVALLAIDPAVPHDVRLAAALALHDRAGRAGSAGSSAAPNAGAPPSEDPGPPDDEIGRRTIEILRRGTSR